MGAVVQVNDNRHGKTALAQTSFGGFVPKGGSSNDSGVLEIIVPDAQASVRWVKHGYPSSLAKWHHHPHIEIHLIREGTGLMMAGNAVVPYEAGQVALIGSNLPHNWVSDIAPGERLRQRDVVCHVRPETIRLLMSGFPETSGFAMVLRRAGQALVLSGALLPTGVKSSEEMLKIVPHDLREASYALGVTKQRTITKIVLRTALPGIVSGAILAVARVIGETAPLLMTAGYIASTNVNLFSGQMTTLPVYVYQEYSKLNANCPANASAACVTTIPMERAWAAALVLILIVLILNLIGRLVAKVFAVKSER